MAALCRMPSSLTFCAAIAVFFKLCFSHSRCPSKYLAHCITFRYRENTANAKSVLSVLGACIKSGDEIELVCEGEDEQEALAALVNAIENGLGE